MRRGHLAVAASAFVLVAGLAAPARAVLLPGTDTLVTVGSPQGASVDTEGDVIGSFSQNKQNEPQVAINPIQTSVVAAGANDNIDLELCNAGNPKDCPFTQGVGVTGVQFSTNGGDSWVQPTYSGWSARHCVGPAPCVPRVGPIGTLPRYLENGLVSNGDPAMVWGPAPAPGGGFSWARQRLYFANLATNFSTLRDEQAFRGPTAIAVSRLDSNNLTAALAGSNTAWQEPVIVSRQSETTFSDKEEIWADNAESSPFFGNVYVCNVAFRSAGAAAPEPVMVATSRDGGDTWRQRQISAATNTAQTGGRQGCTIRTDSRGVVYVFWVGTRIQDRQTVFFLSRSFNGGAQFERPRAVIEIDEVGIFDPVSRRFTFDGIAGARTSTFPSVDIANGAPTGAGATNRIVVTGPDGPTPDAPGEPNERAPIWLSTNGGGTFPLWLANAAAASDRPDFPAIAISPDGGDVYVVYDAFLQPWQESVLAPPRLMQGVVRHIDFATQAVTQLNRGPAGDARGSSANGLTAEFIGDYNYAAAVNNRAVAVWNDARDAASCPAINTYRQMVANGTATASTTDPNRPAPNTDCPIDFGNTDIWGGNYADPSPGS